MRARDNSRSVDRSIVHFLAARSTALPLREESFDLIVASDGLYSWDIGQTERAKALAEIHRTLSRGGHAILTDHMRSRQFEKFIAEIGSSPLRIERTVLFYDRPAYQFESWLKAIREWRIARGLRGSVRLAQLLSGFGRLFGPRGARHICVIARKN
jgi:SAM-dependent methyltransferase